MKATRTLAALAAAILLLPALPAAASTTPATPASLTNQTLGAGYAISEDHTLYTWNETQKPQAALENIRSVADTKTGAKLLIDTQNTLYEQTVDGLQKLAENVAQAAYAGDETLILKTDGSLWRYIPERTGVIAFESLTDVVSFAGTGENFYAVTDDGGLWVWGENAQGQLGLKDSYPRYAPVKAMDKAAQVQLCGDTSVWVLTQDGTLYMTGAFSEKYTAAAYTVVNNEIKSFYTAPTGDAVVFLKNDGTLWGAGPQALTMQEKTTGFVQLLSQVADFAFNETRQHYMALRTDGSLWFWGNWYRGEGTAVLSSLTQPVQIAKNVTAMAAAEYCYVALIDGTLYSWGYPLNGYGIGLTQKSAALPERLLTGIAAPSETMNTAAPTTGISVVVNGVTLLPEADPLIQNGYTLVPLRAIAEALGATVGWDEATRTVTIALAGTTLALIPGEGTFTKNGVTQTLSTPAIIQDGTTLIPLRDVAEALGANVAWDEATRTVTLTKNLWEAPFATLYQVNNDKSLTARSLEIAATFPVDGGFLLENVVDYQLNGDAITDATYYPGSGSLALRFTGSGSTLLTVVTKEGNTRTTRTYRLKVDDNATAYGVTSLWATTQK